MPDASRVPSSLADSRQLVATRYGQQYRDRLAEAAALFRHWGVWPAFSLPQAGEAYDQDAKKAIESKLVNAVMILSITTWLKQRG